MLFSGGKCSCYLWVCLCLCPFFIWHDFWFTPCDRGPNWFFWSLIWLLGCAFERVNKAGWHKASCLQSAALAALSVGPWGWAFPAAAGCAGWASRGLPVVSCTYLSKSLYQGEDLDVCSCKILIGEKKSEDLILWKTCVWCSLFLWHVLAISMVSLLICCFCFFPWVLTDAPV